MVRYSLPTAFDVSRPREKRQEHLERVGIDVQFGRDGLDGPIAVAERLEDAQLDPDDHGPIARGTEEVENRARSSV